MRFGLYNLILEKNYKKLGLDLFEEYIKKHGKPNLIHTNDVKFGIFVADIIKKNTKFLLLLLSTAQILLEINSQKF